MAGTFVVSGGNTTVSFTHIATTARMSAIVNAAAHAIWETGHTVAFETLSNQQKLNLIDAYIKAEIMRLAKKDSIATAMAAAETAAWQNAEDNLAL